MAGADYTAADGSLSFMPGDTEADGQCDAAGG